MEPYHERPAPTGTTQRIPAFVLIYVSRGNYFGAAHTLAYYYSLVLLSNYGLFGIYHPLQSLDYMVLCIVLFKDQINNHIDSQQEVYVQHIIIRTCLHFTGGCPWWAGGRKIFGGYIRQAQQCC